MPRYRVIIGRAAAVASPLSSTFRRAVVLDADSVDQAEALAVEYVRDSLSELYQVAPRALAVVRSRVVAVEGV